MQAYKVKGIVNSDGHLVISDPIDLAPGEVEVIILQSAEALHRDLPSNVESHTANNSLSNIKAFEGLFDNAPPVPPDFDADQAKWEALKEKYHL